MTPGSTEPVTTPGRIVLFALLLGALAGCGGGPAVDAPGPGAMLMGTVATGAPVVGAAIEVVDAQGAPVGSGTSDAAGAYAIALAPSAVPPFVIRASGIVGDATQSLYGVAPAVGTANVSHVTTAITATLAASGDPAEAYARAVSLGLTAQGIHAVDSAYTRAFSNVLPAGASFIRSPFDSSLDAALDNIRVEVKPSGRIVLATTSNLAGSDHAAGASPPGPSAILTLPRGQPPGEAAAAQLGATTPLLTIADLEPLRARLQACFAIPVGVRGTPTQPAGACADAHFVVASDPAAADGFVHGGARWNNTRWNDPGFNPSAAQTPFHLGMFGHALRNPAFDGAQFLKPKIIRPVDAQGGSWVVQFPVQLASGVLVSLGDAVGNKHLVVKRIGALASADDRGWRFVGDQRHYLAVFSPAVQKVIRQSQVFHQTGFNLIFKTQSATDPANRKAVLASIRGKGLPPGGIYLAQNEASCGTGVNATLAMSFLDRVTLDGAPLSEARLAALARNASVGWAGTRTTEPCTGMFRLSQTGNEWGPFALRSWGADGTAFVPGSAGFSYQGSTTAGGNWLSDADLEGIALGEPYSIRLWLSDGSTVDYVNRLSVSMLSLVDAIGYPHYPAFSEQTGSAFQAYAGRGDLSATVVRNPAIYTYLVGMFWSGVSVSQTLGPDARAITLPCDAACGAGDWTPGRAMLKAFSRTADTFYVATQYWNH